MSTASPFVGVGDVVLKDTSNNAYKCGILQGVTLEFSGTMKELRGSKQFPEAVAKVGQKISLKASMGLFTNAMLSAVTGGTITTGSRFIQTDAKTAAASVTVTPPSSGTYVADLGVYDSAGQPMKYNSGTPAVGEYKQAAGVYTFNVGQTGTLQVTYLYSLATGETITLTNQTTGLVTTFAVYTYQVTTDAAGVARKVGYHFPACIVPKMSFSMKNEDWMSQDIEIETMADTSGNVFYNYSA